MDIKINIEPLEECIKNGGININSVKFQKMALLYNALEEGWSIKKRQSTYVFSKNHEGKKEVLEDGYLMQFLKTNFDINKVIL